MVFMNYVSLEEGIPKELHLTDHYFVDRMIWDKDLQREKPIRSLVFAADREGGEICLKTFSVLSEKLYLKLEPYLKDSNHRDYIFTITKLGSGWQTTYEVEAKPLSENSPY